MLERRQAGKRDRSYPMPREVAAAGCGCIPGTWGRVRYGRSTSDENREARVPKRSTGTDRSAVVMKALVMGTGAKGSGQAVVWSKQLETGRCRFIRQTNRSILLRSKCTRRTK